MLGNLFSGYWSSYPIDGFMRNTYHIDLHHRKIQIPAIN
jgi:hypothetical protein